MENITLAPYNEIAVKTFVGTMLRIIPLPVFVQVYKTEDWKNAYLALKSDFAKFMPDVIKTYNNAYYSVLTTYN